MAHPNSYSRLGSGLPRHRRRGSTIRLRCLAHGSTCGGELMQLWRENDSTGLRAEPKLKHTALAVRVTRKQRRTSAWLLRRHSKIGETGSRPASRFVFSGERFSRLCGAGDGGWPRDAYACGDRGKSPGFAQTEPWARRIAGSPRQGRIARKQSRSKAGKPRGKMTFSSFSLWGVQVLKHTLTRTDRAVDKEIIGGAACGSAAELDAFEPANGIALIGDDLGLPDQTYGHDAHGHDANGNQDAFLGFRCG